MKQKNNEHPVVIVGGGPAGLMAAEIIATAGYSVSLYDAMPSVGRKFLLAGIGGMNITHAENHDVLLNRYSYATADIKPFVDQFSAQHLRDWIHGLGIETFVGSSGRVFPMGMKAAPLLRAWLHRLRHLGVQFNPRHQFVGWNASGDLIFQINDRSGGEIANTTCHASAVLLALGGASWQRLGSTGEWVSLFTQKDVQVNPLVPANCGFEIHWSAQVRNHFAGAQLSTVTLYTTDESGEVVRIRGEVTISEYGIEGTSIYALSRLLRDQIYRTGNVVIGVDLLPDLSMEKIAAQLQRPRGKNSLSNFLRKQLGLSPVKIALLREIITKDQFEDVKQLTAAIKNLPLNLTGVRPIDEAISTAGGVKFSELTAQLMLKKLPGVFCAGEMLDWEAPTGGYLLTACFATGRAAGLGLVDYLHGQGEAG